MNLHEIEEKIIAYFEESLNDSEKQSLLNSIQNAPEAKEIFETYQVIYEDFDTDLVAMPSTDFKNNFYKKLEQQEKTAQHKASKRPSLSFIRVLKYAASILLLVAFGTLIGLNWSKNQQISILNKDVLALKSEMTNLLKNESTAVRIKAISMSDELTHSNQDILEVLIQTMNGDASENVRLAAINALEKFADEKMVRTALFEALKHQKDDFIQIKIIHILANLKDENALPHLNDIIEDKDASKFLKREATVGKEIIML